MFKITTTRRNKSRSEAVTLQNKHPPIVGKSAVVCKHIRSNIPLLVWRSSRVLDSSNTFTLGFSDRTVTATPIRQQAKWEDSSKSVQQQLLPYTMADNMLPAGRRSSESYERHLPSLLSSSKPNGFRASAGLENIARRTLGIILLLTTVVLWTASNFIQSASLPPASLNHGC